MSIRDVTFEELLTILRSSPELVAKTAVENLRRDDIDHARRDARESRGNDRRPHHRSPVFAVQRRITRRRMAGGAAVK